MLMLSVETKKKGDGICGYKSCKGRSHKNLKYRLKKMCKEKKISMSQLIINMIENEVNKYEFKMKNKKIIDSRAEGTEKKLKKLKE